MGVRALTGFFITLIVYFILAFSHIEAVVLCAVAVLCGFAAYEIMDAAGYSRNIPLLTATVGAAMALAVIPGFGEHRILLPVFLASLAVFAAMMARQKNAWLDKPWKAVLLVVAVALLYRSIPELRKLEYGLYYLVGAVTLCFVTDVAAYLVGSRFGKHKLMHRVSPNKTTEGSVAGLAAAWVLMLILGLLLQGKQGIRVNWAMLSIYAVSASAVGQFGDLSMSAVKRICGKKDFGNLFPGHGGMLDRFDSHLLCIPYTLLFAVLTGGFFG